MFQLYRSIEDNKNDTIISANYLALIALSNLILCGIAHKKKSLTLSGAFATFIVGTFVFMNIGFGGWCILVVFFVSSTILTKIARPYSMRVASGIQKKGGCRDYMQVIANGGPATICAILYGLTGNHVYLTFYACAVAESNSDTWAGEIGILSNKPPVLITSFKECEPGLSGGVTILGTFGGFCGSVVIAISWFAIFYNYKELNHFSESLIIIISGFVGCIMDSVLGSTVQGHYYDESTKQITEHPVRNGVKLPLKKGISFIDNDIVNILSNICSIIIAYALEKCLQ